MGQTSAAVVVVVVLSSMACAAGRGNPAQGRKGSRGENNTGHVPSCNAKGCQEELAAWRSRGGLAKTEGRDDRSTAIADATTSTSSLAGAHHTNNRATPVCHFRAGACTQLGI